MGKPKQGTKEYYDLIAKQWEQELLSFVATTRFYLYTFTPFSDEEEEEDIKALNSLLNKIINRHLIHI